MGSPGSVIILDTHVWLWWLHEPGQLSVSVQNLLAQEDLQVSAISVWEVAVKVSLGKLILPLEINTWYERARSHPGLTVVPVSASDAIASTQLPGIFHRDPADRIIVALARQHGVPLVTCDAKILNYPHVRTIW